MKNKILILVTLLLSTNAAAETQTFEQKHYTIIKSIIWAADKVEIPRELLLALCWGESSFRTTGVTHNDGYSPSYGICQVKLGTAMFMDTVYKHKIKVSRHRLENPRVNAFYAAKYLKYQLNRYDDDWKLAVDAYNKGNALSRKTTYVKRFIKNKARLHKQIPLAGK